MRILLSADPELPVPPPLYGGIERIVHSLLCELQRRGHVVALAANPQSRSPSDSLFPWSGGSSVRWNDTVKNTRRLQHAVAEFAPDLVHSFSRLAYLIPLLPRRIPKIMSYQRLTGGRQIAIANKIGRETMRFTACSEFIANQGRPWGGRWTVIPNFVDLEKYDFVEATPTDAPLVFLSRIEALKGAHLAIDVCERLGKKLIIAGNHSTENDEAGDYWRQLIKPKINDTSVRYVGAVDDQQKNRLLGEAAALIVPIQWDEPFGIVFIESLACGTPVIACPRGALPEIIRHGVDGFLANSVTDLSNAVINVDKIDRRTCRRRVEQAFCASVAVGQYEMLYRELQNIRN